MHRALSLIVAVILLVAVSIWLERERLNDSPSDEIEYQGQKFKLSKVFASYEDYKDDPSNLDPAENARIEKAVTNAKIGSVYSSIEELVEDVCKIQFPGYGMTGFGQKKQPDGSTLDGFAIEIPRADKDRVLVFRGEAGQYALIDDFVTGSGQAIADIQVANGKVQYVTFDGGIIASHPYGGK
jgi:hypothetical protein